ncbi:hypothetical protein VTL71DRAFT_3009 [Oculimacula yallundae]|uniref:Uncharacterized protein n=1 Tax=Oculimacula yallundae TaxID=86028 RepID=A0ABR4C5W7_9HELO
MAQIVKEGGDAAAAPYCRTPLDFISRDEWHWPLFWTHGMNILRAMHITFAPSKLPHDRFENTIWHNITSKGALLSFIIMCIAYTAIFIAAWDAHFPTYAERVIWRISSLSLTATVILYFIITAFAWVVWPAVRRYFNHRVASKFRGLTSTSSEESTQTKPTGKLSRVSTPRSKLPRLAAKLRNNSTLKDPALNIPLKATLPMYIVGFCYCISRALILILDMIQLRSLPLSAFDTVDWGSFLPHFS